MEQKIEEMYRKSLKLASKEKTDYLDKLLVICEDTKQYNYGYLVRFELIQEFKKTGNNYRALQLYRDNIKIYLECRFNYEQILMEFDWMAKHIDAVLNIQQQEINDFFTDMQKIFESNSLSLRSYYQEKYSYLMRVGRWEEAFTVYSKWMVTSRDKYSQSIGKEEADRTFYYFSVGDYPNGKYVFETVKKGLKSPPGTRTYAYPRAARYYFELKDWEMTSYLLQRGYSYCENKIESIEEVAEIMKPLSILNPKIALKLWQKHRYNFNKTDNQRAKFSYGISSILLEKTFEKQLIGSGKLIKLKNNVKEMYDIQEWMDQRNETDFYQDELIYWLDIWEKLNRKLEDEK